MMIAIFNKILMLMLISLMVQGCALKESRKAHSDIDQKGTKRIAILPVKNMTTNVKAGQILREMVLNELYFKGYPKIPLQMIDEKLFKVYKENVDYRREDIPPKAVGDLLGADAVLYITLDECSTSFSIIYAPTKVSVVFELRSVKTGETIWNSRHRTVKRNYGISREQLEMESFQVYEPAIQEVVERAMKTLPDGPDSIT